MNIRGDRIEITEDGKQVFKLSGDFVVEEKEKGVMLHRAESDIKKVYIEVSTRCNLDCVTCIRNTWSENINDMSMELYRSILSDLSDLPELSEIIFGGFGEPLMHPKIDEMVSLAKEAGYRVSITTNGLLLEKEIVDKLIELRADELVVSIDSFSQEEFGMIRSGGELNRLLENLKMLNRKKESENTIFPRLNMEFVLMKSNREQFEELSSRARELGIMSILVTNLLPYTEDMTEEILYGHAESKLDMPIQFWATPIRGLSTMCTMDLPSMKWGADQSCDFVSKEACTITQSGDVSPCYALMHSYDYFIFGRQKSVDAHYFGNLHESSLDEIWKTPEYIKFRDRVRNFSFPSCEDCELKDKCTYAEENQDCWGNDPSCADCLWAQGIVRCP